MKPCREFRRALKTEGRLSPGSEQHLFGCPPCRRRARQERVEREIDGLAALPPAETVVPPDFVARVMRGLPTAAAASRRRPATRWAWAAALAIFSVAAGYGYTAWTDSVAASQQVGTSPAPVEDLALLNF
jgi:predicted anti-sigma-YlaC factor YlaD